MLANLETVFKALPDAAIGSFNILDLDMAVAVVETAEALKIPTIVGIASRHFSAIQAPQLLPSIKAVIDQSEVPIALHLDHANPEQLDMIKQALNLGFTSIMIDGSQKPFEENVKITQCVVQMAKDYGASVEGEIGGIAGEEGVADTNSVAPESLPFTDQTEAHKFVSFTGVSALAIAVGTAHGIYAAAPKISFDTIKSCQNSVDVPLVMHGATGVNDVDLQFSVRCGIRKINYFSGLLKNAMDTVRANSSCTDNDFLQFKSDMQKNWKRTLRKKMQLYALKDVTP